MVIAEHDAPDMSGVAERGAGEGLTGEVNVEHGFLGDIPVALRRAAACGR
jgi:hypothetical protein